LSEDRFSRQKKLAEVGEAGQARVAAASYEVRGPDGAENDVELTYLERAGALRVVRLPEEAPRAFSHEGAFRFQASREVAAGAWRALVQLKAALAMPEHPANPAILESKNP
jgi:hypothetical protein